MGKTKALAKVAKALLKSGAKAVKKAKKSGAKKCVGGACEFVAKTSQMACKSCGR